jgi:hypothetical protein
MDIHFPLMNGARPAGAGGSGHTEEHARGCPARGAAVP